MIELLFLLIWAIIFFGGYVLIRKRIKAHIKVYLLLILHFFYLTGIFYFYPVVLELKNKL
ncbi:hypothetical protein BuS5_03707 [Desulfosarcina sp. BuS5]|nr:hypothetical protein BuS5_03707 [Desulfosarcina sp. BuS5]